MEAKQRIEPIIDTLADLLLPFAFAFSAMIAVAVIWFNVAGWRRRKLLSASERKAEDISADTENQIW